MDIILTTDDDRQTPSNGESSSDDVYSVTNGKLLPVEEDDQQRLSSRNSVHVCKVKVSDQNSVPNLTIKHPNQPAYDEGQSLNHKTKQIIDEHVKVSHVKRSSLCSSLQADALHSRLDAISRRKSTGMVTVSRASRRTSQCANTNSINREATQIISGQSVVPVDCMVAAINICQDSKKKAIASRPVITRISFSNELPCNIIYKDSHVSVKHISVNQKKPS